MFRIVKNIIRILLDKRKLKLVSETELMQQKLILGRLLSNQQKLLNIEKIEDTEFSIFSQWGDDGIIQYLIHQIKDLPKTFIEFGVENYRESNTRFLLCNNNWRGLIFDGSQSNMAFVRQEAIYWQYNLRAEPLFISAENINEAIKKANFSGEIGILHIDIDGNDYWVWKEISQVNPVLVIMEYNSAFGKNRAITTPYDPNFYRTRAHHSNLYFGASLRALCVLAEEKGYAFIGSNSHGNNAYFVRKDKSSPLQNWITDFEKGYVRSEFREDRDAQGQLTFRDWSEVVPTLNALKVVNVLNGQMENL